MSMPYADQGVSTSDIQQIANMMDSGSSISVAASRRPGTSRIINSSDLTPNSVVNKLLSTGHELLVKDGGTYKTTRPGDTSPKNIIID